MSEKIMGIDFGTCTTKFAVIQDGKVIQHAVVDTPENLMRDGKFTSAEAMIDFLKENVKANNLKCKKCAISLSSSVCFTKMTTVPLMSQEQLQINLPYEFKDYIVNGKDKYVYDYAVLSRIRNEDDDTEMMELMTCASSKELIETWVWIFKRAGLKLVIAIPDEFALRNLCRSYLRDFHDPICFIDLGYSSSRIYIFRDGRLEASRIIEASGSTVDRQIADRYGIDVHLAKVNKEANVDQILVSDTVMNVNRSLAVDIMRALNFYEYDSGSTLHYAYVYGGMSNNRPLLEEIKDTCNLEFRPIRELVKDYASKESNLLITALGTVVGQGGVK